MGRALEDKGLRIGGWVTGKKEEPIWRVGGGEGSSEAWFGLGHTLRNGYSCLACVPLPTDDVLKDSVVTSSKTGPEGRAIPSTQCEQTGLY